MVKKSVFGLVVLLLALQFVIAVDTGLTIKTVPNQRVDISVVRPNQVYSLIKSFHVNSDSNGEAKVTFSHDENTFNVRVWVKGDGVEIASKKFEEEYPTGEPLTLELYPKWYSPPVDETIMNETNSSSEINLIINNENTSEITVQEVLNIENNSVNSSGTGLVISKGTLGFSKKTIYYFIGIVVLLSMVFFVLLKIKHSQSVPKEIKVKKLSEFNAERKEQLESPDHKEAIEIAEKKIEEAQKEINKLKNEDKIKEIRDRMNQEQKELDRLTRGDSYF